MLSRKKWALVVSFTIVGSPSVAQSTDLAHPATWISIGLFLACLLLSVALFKARQKPNTPRIIPVDLENLGSLLDDTEHGLIGLSRTNDVAFINTQARSMLGIPATATPFPWPSSLESVDASLKTPGEAANWTEKTILAWQGPDGQKHYFRVAHLNVEQPGSALKELLLIEDFSPDLDSREKKIRNNSLDALGQLTGGIAHDFNNLLAMIEYSIQLADHEEKIEKRRQYHSAALSSVQRGANLTDRLLTFAKKQPAKLQSHSINRVFSDFKVLAQSAIEETITVDFDTQDDDLWVLCDIAQFENAILNLFLNSRDAILRSNKDGQIKVSAKRAVRSNNAFVEITIQDNGPGMSDDVKDRAIEPFFTTKNPASGTGLGLSMVYGFIHQFKGELYLSSEEGRGTEVKMLLPAGKPSVEEKPEIQFMPEPSGHHQSVLLVEDEGSLLGIISDVVDTLGYTVTSAQTSKKALNKIENDKTIDLLITDIVMPEMGGFELARRARAIRPDLPIIYMSGYSEFDSSDMGDVLAPILRKPCSPLDLSQAIEKALRATQKISESMQ